MTRGPTFWIVALSVLAAGAGFFLQPRSLPPHTGGRPYVAIGDSAPGATFSTLDGISQPLSHWRGRRVLINFWASWCMPCRQEMPLLSAAWSRHPHDGIALLGVAEDTADAVRESLTDLPVSYPVLLADRDTPGGSSSFGNRREVLPYSVLIGEDGRILRQKAGALSEAELEAWLTP